MNYLIIGEPKGNQTIKLIELGIDPANIYVWEDSTKGQYCVRMEGATVTDNLDDFDGMKFDVVIGNPPYGSGGNLAIKFLNKCAELSDDIRMVLPLSFKKVSIQNKVRLDLTVVEENELPSDTFPNSIRTVYQRWVKTDTVREKVKTLTTHRDFEFVSREKADLMVGRVGNGPAGKVKTEDFVTYKKDHYFLKVASKQVVDNLISIENQLVQLASAYTNGMKSLSKHELITCYIQNFGS